METKIILQNQVLIMEAMLCDPSISNEIKKRIREQIMYTEAVIRAIC